MTKHHLWFVWFFTCVVSAWALTGCDKSSGAKRAGFIGGSGGDSPSAGAGGERVDCVSVDEICDGIDNDCDGTVDEETGGEACGVGRGVCRADGMFECVDEGTGPELVCSESPGILPIGAVDVCGAPDSVEPLSPMNEEWIDIDQEYNEDCDDLIDERCTCAAVETLGAVPISVVLNPALSDNALGLGCLPGEPPEDPASAEWQVPGGETKINGAPEVVLKFRAPVPSVFRFDVEPEPFDSEEQSSRNPIIELRPVDQGEACASRDGAICRRDDGRSFPDGAARADALRHTGVVKEMQANEEVWVIVQSEANDMTVGPLRLSITDVGSSDQAEVIFGDRVEGPFRAQTCDKRIVRRNGDDGDWCAWPDHDDCEDSEGSERVGICIDNDGRYVSVDIGALGRDGARFGGRLGPPVDLDGRLLPVNRADWFSMSVSPDIFAGLGLGNLIEFRLSGAQCVTDWLDLEVFAACAGRGGPAGQARVEPRLGVCQPPGQGSEAATLACLGGAVDVCRDGGQHIARTKRLTFNEPICGDGSDLILWVGIMRRAESKTDCNCNLDLGDQPLLYTVEVSWPDLNP